MKRIEKWKPLQKPILKSKKEWEQRLLSEGAESDTVPINRLRMMQQFNKVIDKVWKLRLN